jgi:hypothetical protein
MFDAIPVRLALPATTMGRRRGRAWRDHATLCAAGG